MSEFQIRNSGQEQKFSTGAVRDVQSGKGRYDLLPMHALYRIARVFELGALRYKEDNWRQGIPLRRYADSAMRHLCKFIQGATDEDHAAQAAWNILCLLETKYMIDQGLLSKELDNMPNFAGPNDVTINMTVPDHKPAGN
jgi:hypothetical protein